LTVSLHHRNGQWRISKYTERGGLDMRLIGSDLETLQQAEHPAGYTGYNSPYSTSPIAGVIESDPSQAIPLLRYTPPESVDPNGGFMIWLERDLRRHYREPLPEEALTEADRLRKEHRQWYLVRQQ
jgi:hypothetical protein